LWGTELCCGVLFNFYVGLLGYFLLGWVRLYKRHGQSAALQLIFAARQPLKKNLIYTNIVYQNALKMAKCGNKAQKLNNLRSAMKNIFKICPARKKSNLATHTYYNIK